MNGPQYVRYLEKIFDIRLEVLVKRGGTGHRFVLNRDNGRSTIIPWHPSKQLKKGLMEQIKKDLGLK